MCQWLPGGLLWWGSRSACEVLRHRTQTSALTLHALCLLVWKGAQGPYTVLPSVHWDIDMGPVSKNRWAGLLASWLHECNPTCFQFFLGSHLGSVLVTRRPCSSQVSIAEESGSTYTRDSKFKLVGRSILAYNSVFLIPFHLPPGCILLTHTPAQGPSWVWLCS